MAANIGGTSCDFVQSGDVTPCRERVSTWHVPGRDSVGAMQLGQNDGGGSVRALKFGTAAAVNAWIDAIEAMAGTVVTIENDFGDTDANCLITRVAPAQKSAAYVPGSSTTTRGQLDIEYVVLVT